VPSGGRLAVVKRVLANPRHRPYLVGVGCFVAALALLAGISYTVLDDPDPTQLVMYMTDVTGVTHNNADAHATVSHQTSFQSTPDQSWEAGALTVPCPVVNLESNPVDMSPHLYVDLDGNGAFTEDECLFNPITYESDGSVSSWGNFLAPGQSLEQIDLVRPLSAGTYDCKMVYTAVHTGTAEQANGMVMNFSATVA